MDGNVRATRSGRPLMTITLPERNDSFQVEEDFLTPPIWVAMNPPPIFERPEMKRSVSDISSWGGDEDEQSSTSLEKMDHENEIQERVIPLLSVLMVASTTGDIT
jgi:hypothetical protein